MNSRPSLRYIGGGVKCGCLVGYSASPTLLLPCPLTLLLHSLLGAQPQVVPRDGGAPPQKRLVLIGDDPVAAPHRVAVGADGDADLLSSEFEFALLAALTCRRVHRLSNALDNNPLRGALLELLFTQFRHGAPLLCVKIPLSYHGSGVFTR